MLQLSRLGGSGGADGVGWQWRSCIPRRSLDQPKAAALGASSALSSLAARSTCRGRMPCSNFAGDVSKFPRRDFTLFSNQAAPQWEEAIAKLLIVLKFPPRELGGILVLVSGTQTGWVQGADGSR